MSSIVKFVGPEGTRVVVKVATKEEPEAKKAAPKKKKKK